MKYIIPFIIFTFHCGDVYQTLYTPMNIFHIKEETLEVMEENSDTIVYRPKTLHELKSFLEEVSRLDVLIEREIPDESWVVSSWSNNWPKPVVIYNYKNMYNMPNYVNWDTIGYITRQLKFKTLDRL